MSLTKYYVHDVFISYASASNVPPPGQDYHGLITEFFTRLKTELGGLGVGGGLDIFFDRRDINDHTPLTDQVLSAARASAVMVVFHSPAYDASSDWCHREFHDWQEFNNQSRDRLFVVSLNKDDPPTRSPVLAGTDPHFREFFYELNQRWFPFDTDALYQTNSSGLTFKNEVSELAKQIKKILLRLQKESPNKRIFLTCGSERQRPVVADLRLDFLAQGYHVLETSPWILDAARRRRDAENLIALADLVVGVEEKLDPGNGVGVHAAEQLEIAGRLGKAQLRWLPGDGHGFSEQETRERKSHGEIKAESLRDFKQRITDQLTARISSVATVAAATAKAPTLALIVHSKLDRNQPPGDMAQKLKGCGAGSDRLEDSHPLGLPSAVPAWQKDVRRAIKEARANKVIILHGGNRRDWIDARLRNYQVLADDLEPRPHAALCEYPPLPKNQKMAREYDPPPGTIDVFRHDDVQALANFLSR